MILEENKLEPNFPPYTKIKYTSIKGLNVKKKSKEYMGKYLSKFRKPEIKLIDLFI